MKLQKRKQEPFYVKKIRLKHSVIKTNEILQTIAITDLQKKSFITMREQYRFTPNYAQQHRSCSRQKSINQQDLYHNKVSMVNYDKMKKLLKICNHKRLQENANNMMEMGLQVRRIIGDPEGKKRVIQNDKKFLNEQHSSAEQTNIGKRNQAKSFKKAHNRQLKTEERWECSNYSQRGQLIATYDSYKSDKKKKDRQLAVSYQKKTSPRSSQKKNKVYLYQRMADSQDNKNEQMNQIYEKRVKSYIQFLWKNMISHNIYINLDLLGSQTFFKKRKAYVGIGNNCNMIKGLIKRRFWWIIVDELSDECSFVWTQLKINSIFNKQQLAPLNQIEYVEDLSFQQNKKRMSKTCISSQRRHKFYSNNKKTQRQHFKQIYECNKKLLHTKDMEKLMPFFEKYQPLFNIGYPWEKLKSKDVSYAYKIKELHQNYKKINFINNLSIFDSNCLEQKHNFYQKRPMVHNHFQNNFLLGNKKALFYNLREHYQKNKKNVFEYIPLTFHIKHGFKDNEYKRFVQYFHHRQKIIKKEEQKQIKINKKLRNIWIVKPGQNTNQGKGINVIDQIYELNNIIKDSEVKKKNQCNQNFSSRTFIVQMYIDRPLLYNDRKFDIRHYVLITNLYGVMRGYWYQEGYGRTASYIFNINNFQPEIHLTNDFIQKRYPDYGRYQPANKVSYSDLQLYISNISDKKTDFKRDIIPLMKQIAINAIKSISKKISPKQQMNNFQIFGLDFMIDRNFKPWLIEINTNPCLECPCPLLDRIIPYMIQQSLKLSIDLVYPPPCHYPNSSKHYAPYVNMENFKYQLIFDSLIDGGSEQGINKRLIAQIGQVEQDQVFRDNGKEIKLEDFT